MLAFASPVVTDSTTWRPSFATRTCRQIPSTRTAVCGAPARRIPSAQYNYNIYQDNKDRSRREIGGEERSVIVQKPLGIVLEEGQDGMVFIAKIESDGNAADDENIREGDVIVAVSATFGDEVWSTRGVGLERVMKSIRVRAGDLVTLVLESPAELADRKNVSVQEAAARRTLARDTRGEPEVLNPVTWTASKKDLPATYDTGADPVQGQIDDKLRQKLLDGQAAPYTQNWILWISSGIGLLVIISFLAGLR
jgi:PDZ domain